jgi:putative two-component system response regulator
MTQQPVASDENWETRDVRDEYLDPDRVKNQFLAKIKHDLRTPMNHIIGFSEILMEEAEDYQEDLPQTFLEDMNKIHTSGKQLLSFINDIFDPLKATGLGLAMIRHHLRCHLNSIMGYSEILLEDSDTFHPEVFVPDLQKIHTASKRLLGLVDEIPNIWEFSGSQPVQPAPISSSMPAPVFARTAQTAEAKADRGSYSILVVDDNEDNRDMLSRRLENLGYEIKRAEDGQQALDKLANENFDLVLLDVMMPVLDGYQTLERIKADQNLHHIPVIMISALDDIAVVTRCIEIGAEDYLPKPFDPALLKARVGASINKKRLNDLEIAHSKLVSEYNQQLTQQVKEQVREISISQLGMIFALSKLTESRDPETGEHLERMCEYSKTLSIQLAKSSKYSEMLTESYIENLYTASVLHDIGKVGVPDHILQKNGKLTEHEFEIIKTHTSMGGNTLRLVDQRHPGNQFIHIGVDIAESHHEKWDGTGYPNGLAGEDIPLCARIVALADVYDALRTQRCYKPALPHEEAKAIIVKSRGSHFDPVIVDAFLAVEHEIDAIWTKLTDVKPNTLLELPTEAAQTLG